MDLVGGYNHPNCQFPTVADIQCAKWAKVT